MEASGAAFEELSQPKLVPWRKRGVKSLVTGSVTRLVDGRYDVRLRLWDTVKGQDLGGQS